MRWILYIIMCLVTSLKCNGPVNYCGSKMCSHTDAHTFCQYPAGPGPACTGHMEARLSTHEKTRVMIRLNRRRRQAALGLRTMPAAGDMLKLRWIEELAREAQRWANQCRPPSNPEEQDVCRDLYSITVGQCVASVVGEAPGLRPETMVDIWFMQSMHYKGNVTVYMDPEEDINYYGDFGQMMWSRAFMVGCGRSRFMTDWRGRVRSVERLVCNFAPRGPAVHRPLWHPAAPASACPPRAKPDPELPGLCTYQYEMEEKREESNLTSFEDQLLFDTVLDIERNKSLDYIGSLDEIYLRKLAVANMEKAGALMSSYTSVQKRDLIDALGKNDSVPIKTELNVVTNNISRYVGIGTKTKKKKASLVGRPKSYEVEDLNDQSNDQDTKNDYKIQATATSVKDVFGYYDYNDIEDTRSTTLTTAKVFEYTNIETTQKIGESIDLNETDVTTGVIISRSDTNELISSVDSTLSSAPYVLKESSIQDNVLDDYLTDTETARQLQEALERMERSLAVSPAKAGKVRRELRPQKNYRRSPDLTAEIERNRTIDRGPMLNMVLKYMPYLKTYEKNFLGNSSSSVASFISQFFIIINILMFLGF